jgi:hypothetical protein
MEEELPLADRPFLEISVLSAQDPEFDIPSFLERAKAQLLSYLPRPPEQVYISDKPALVLKFATKADFEEMYEKDIAIYSYLLEHMFGDESDGVFPPLSQTRPPPSARKGDGGSSHPTGSDTPPEGEENYLVLRYRSNYIEPMRRNYNLVYQVNRHLGAQIVNEELHDGFIRFVKTKRDYESMFIGNDEMAKWREFFRVLGFGPDNPTVTKFMDILQSYL